MHSGKGESFENAVFASSISVSVCAAEEHLLKLLEKFVFNL